ncbi:hypothetical protein OG609_39395 [Streptomyces sp. NBC_01224]|uniref:hypothetical protein n=1 Tax=Streptomyces sp. NBC_01224 TaxID=2903783 RepID=UPI002E0DD532|nr:hypothetical protein OG609_39395 [Streptomyces sp. NBC_01224]
MDQDPPAAAAGRPPFGHRLLETPIDPHANAEPGITTVPSAVTDTAVLARCVRGQWAIDAQHFVRDVTFGEDACRARTGSLPRVLATLRSLAISLAHLAEWTNNAAAHDHYRNHPADALHELGLTT